MTGREHVYTVTVAWTGNQGTGTSGYTAYGREFSMTAPGKLPISGSSDPSFRGDGGRWNPEDLLVGSLAACHQLWYLHLCAVSGIRVMAYSDEATGTMIDRGDSGGQFTNVILRPAVTIAHGDDCEKALALHNEAHTRCFVANSVKFDVTIAASIREICVA